VSCLITELQDLASLAVSEERSVRRPRKQTSFGLSECCLW